MSAMSMTFTKLFSSITESTIWVEDDGTRLVWITMLAMADRYGRVYGSIPGLGSRARVSLAATEAAIEKFLGPDKYSRTEDFEGRRIEKIDGGWRLLNYEKYRELRDDEVRKEQNRMAKRRSRASAEPVTVSQGQPESANQSAHAEAEASNTFRLDAGEATKKPVSRNRDPLFDALAGVSGAIATELTKSAARACGVALAEIKAVCPDLTVEEIARRAANYRTHFEGAALTPSALKTHWATCGVAYSRTNYRKPEPQLREVQ